MDKGLIKTRKKNIKQLLNEKQYDKIFELYGQRIYNSCVPKKHKHKDIKQLLEQGRLEDVYRKYGMNTYEKYLNKMQQKDVFYETGSKPKSIINRIKNAVMRKILPYTLTMGLALPTSAVGLLDAGYRSEAEKNGKEYAREIEKYNDKITQYAEKINAMNLTDTQIFVKVIYDMWNSIDGYKEPDSQVWGYLRLALDDEKVGQCRHFADDFTAKINAINPEYNARNLVVKMENTSSYLLNVERKTIENDGIATQVNENNTSSEIARDVFEEVMGNHMVSIVDIPEKNINLVVDPTNPSMGVFKDGKIYMFSTSDGKGLEIRRMGQVYASGFDSAVEISVDVAKSFFNCPYTIEELEKVYGIDALNKDLEYIKSLGSKIIVPRVDIDYNMIDNNKKDKRPEKEIEK